VPVRLDVILTTAQTRADVCEAMRSAANAFAYPFTNARSSFAIRASEGWWMYIMWPASK
jgi:hypothetical protein